MLGTPQQSLGNGIYCLDANYVKPGLACCYLVVENGQVAIIETGTNNTVPYIEAAISSLGIKPSAVKYVIPTHVHLDHAGGAGLLMSRYTQAQLIIHPRGERHMVNPIRLIQGVKAVYGKAAFDRLYGEPRKIEASRVVAAEDGQIIALAGRPLLFRHTPGHANHHFCVWDEKSRGWFTGDTLGLAYQFAELGENRRYLLPTTSPVQFSPDNMLMSIDQIMAVQPERLFLTHYGELKNPEQYIPALKQQVRQWCQLVSPLRGQRRTVEQIQTLITDACRQQLHNNWPVVNADSILTDLAFDLELSAQGLDVWLQQQESEEE